LANLSLKPILKSLASAIAEILKENPQIVGSFLAKGDAHFFFWV